MEFDVEMHTPPNERDIKELWAFMSLDANGNKGICASIIPNLGSTPLVTGSPRVLEAMKQIANRITRESGIAVQLYHFVRDADPVWQTGDNGTS